MTSLAMQARLNAIRDAHACMRVLEKQVLCWASPSPNAHGFNILCGCACMKNCCFVPLLCQQGVFVTDCSTRLDLSEGNFHFSGFSLFPYMFSVHSSLMMNIIMISLNESNLFACNYHFTFMSGFFIFTKRITHKNSSSLKGSTLFSSLCFKAKDRHSSVRID